MNLLAIDNCSDILDAIADCCIFQGAKCNAISQGLEVSSEIQKMAYDLILLDIAMPGYNGFDILQQLKNQGVRNNNIVVFTATNLTLGDFKDYMEIGIKEVIQKPINLLDLETIIKKYK